MGNHSTCSEMGVVDKSVNERKWVLTCSCDKLCLTLLCQTCQTCNLLFFVDTQPWHQHLPSQSMYSGCPIVHCVASTPLYWNISPVFSKFLFIQWVIRKVLPFYKMALSTTPWTPLVTFLFLLKLIPSLLTIFVLSIFELEQHETGLLFWWAICICLCSLDTSSMKIIWIFTMVCNDCC